VSKEFPVKWRFGVIDNLSAPLRKMKESFKPITDAAKKAQSEFTVLQKSSEGLRKSLSKVGKSTQNVGKAMTLGITAPVTAFGASVIKASLGFETSMNKVAALTRATGKPLEDMRNMAKDLGATTQFSASEAADAMAFLGMAGFKTNEILQATPGLLDLAAASGTDLAKSADIASNILGAFGLKATEMGRVADVLALTTASSNVTMEMLSESMKNAAPVAKQFGLSIEDTASAVGLLGNIGIQGSDAGTSLKNMMLQLAAPSSNVKKIFKALGVEATDSNGKMKGLSEIFQQLGPALSKLPQSKQLAVLNEVFGKRAISGAGEMLTQAMAIGEDGKNAITKFTESLQNSNGAARQMAETMMKGGPGAVKNFASAFEGLQLAIADSGIMDAFVELVNHVTSLIRQLSQLSPSTLKFISIAAMLAAAIGPLLFIFGSFIAMIPSMITGINLIRVGFLMLKPAVFMAMLPFIKFIAIAGLIAAAAYLIYKNWEPIKDFFSDLFTNPLEMMKDMIGYAKELGSKALSFLGIGDGKSDTDRKLEAQGFRLSGPSGDELGADSEIKKSMELKMQRQKAQISVDFSNMPKNTKVMSSDKDSILSLNTGMVGMP
jgi:TP901 family phage tail tape measure protein